MRRKKTTRTFELTIDWSELFVVPKPRAPTLAWCQRCGGRVPFVVPEEAARSVNVSVRSILHRIESAEIHFLETRDGRLLVCLESLGPFG